MCGVGYATFQMQYPGLIPAKIRVLVQASVKGHPELDKEGVPLAASFAKTEDQRRILELIFSQGVFGRPLAVAPEERGSALLRPLHRLVDRFRQPEIIGRQRDPPRHYLSYIDSP